MIRYIAIFYVGVMAGVGLMSLMAAAAQADRDRRDGRG